MKRAMTCAVLPVSLVLSGCGWFGGDKPAQGGTAQGEVLPGSTSDAMIQIDQVKSQAPLAPKSEAGENVDGKPAAKDKPKSDAPAAAEAPEPEPAAEPAAEE